MSRYEDEQKMIEDAMKQFPAEFGLRAFPNKRFRIAHKSSHFVLDGQVQLVVQTKMTPEEQEKYSLPEWSDFGRSDLAHTLHEVVK